MTLTESTTAEVARELARAALRLTLALDEHHRNNFEERTNVQRLALQILKQPEQSKG